jgi:pimeloyl-ACP methyl ester carboxylesterase
MTTTDARAESSTDAFIGWFLNSGPEGSRPHDARATGPALSQSVQPAGHTQLKEDRTMSTATIASQITAPTQLLQAGAETYAYRRFGSGPGRPLLCLQHFTGTLDNWDSAVTDPLASGREVILFDNAGVGRSSGKVPGTVAGMAQHALAFLDGLGLDTCDVLGFSLGGMVAQQMALDRPAAFRRMVLVATAPRGGHDIMHLEKPSLATYLNDPTLRGYAVLQKIFFAPTATSQSAGEAFIGRLALRTEDRDPASGPEIAAAQMTAFRDWERPTGEPFRDLQGIRQPTLVINGVNDDMIPVANSYMLSENLPNAMLLTYPDAGHGALFQWHESFTRHVAAFLASDSRYAPY